MRLISIRMHDDWFNTLFGRIIFLKVRPPDCRLRLQSFYKTIYALRRSNYATRRRIVEATTRPTNAVIVGQWFGDGAVAD